MSEPQEPPAFVDQPPQSSGLTDYDRRHFITYMRLLDAADEGADWREVVRVVFHVDPDCDAERAQRIHAAHLSRARWMTEHGYRDLIQSAAH